jgi:hypothetical protein
MAASTAWRFSGTTDAESLMTRETVETDTPAAFATSLMFATTPPLKQLDFTGGQFDRFS